LEDLVRMSQGREVVKTLNGNANRIKHDKIW
jgi:hypothetical protein